jgi:hypothetical protein
MQKRKIFLLMALIFAGCRKPYNPPAINAPNNYLVVEGVINSGPDSTFIKLSRTVKLSSLVIANPELHAVLTVESDQGNSYPLVESANGVYVSAGLNLDNTRKYRLRVKTANNEQYLSDFVAVVNSPPIDSINYVIKSNGLNLYSNTHDPKNNTHYYRWEYQETWIFHTQYFSNFKSNGDTVLGRDLANDEIYRCWKSDTSSGIMLGSSAKLKQDVIFENPLIFIGSTSEKFTSKYSILLKQYALTADAFTFWTNLKKNTEQLGSIFDAQPSEISGNMHCVSDPGKPVIGYISIGAVASQRIFISIYQLPSWTPDPIYPDCSLVHDCCYYDHVSPTGAHDNQVDELINYKKGSPYDPYYIPIDAITVPGHPPIGYTASSENQCVDCTLRGTNKQPAFWK